MPPIPNNVGVDTTDPLQMRRRRINRESEGTKPSIACSFAAELIEPILKNIPVLDLMIAASEFPPAWRAVVESSKEVVDRITHFPWIEEKRHEDMTQEEYWSHISTALSGRPPPTPVVQAGESCTFKTTLPSIGTLYVHRRQSIVTTKTITTTTANSTTTTTITTKITATDPPEAFFFAPRTSPSTIVVLDPLSKSITYQARPTHGCGFVDLRDFQEKLVVAKAVNTHEQGTLFKYVVTFYGRDCDEKGLLRDVGSPVTRSVDVTATGGHLG